MTDEITKQSLEPADEALMLLTARDDSAAFETLVERHQNPLLNFFIRMGAYTDAEDLAQETFVRVFNYRKKYRVTAKFTTFLYTVARHVWLDLLRKKKRHEDFELEHKDDEQFNRDGEKNRAEARIDARIALSRLPEKLRSVVVLGICQGMPYDEIAKTLEIPEGTVKSRMFNAISQLKNLSREIFHK